MRFMPQTPEPVNESLVFSSEKLYSEMNSNALKVRDLYFNKFKSKISLLLERKKPRNIVCDKGRISPRHVHKYQYSDNVFQRRTKTTSSDTTIIFLIDGSGSMEGMVNVEGVYLSAISACGSVASAFAKSCEEVLGNKIGLEVFVKSAPPVHSESLTGTDNKGMVMLTRVYSSRAESDHNKLCTLVPNSPLTSDSKADIGSFTSEYAVLPALMKWVRKNVHTKKVIVFNMTDGESYCTIGKDAFQFRSKHSKMLRYKYLRGIPNVTLMFDYKHDARLRSEKISTYRDIYGDNMIYVDNDFSGALFSTFMRFIEEC